MKCIPLLALFISLVSCSPAHIQANKPTLTVSNANTTSSSLLEYVKQHPRRIAGSALALSVAVGLGAKYHMDRNDALLYRYRQRRQKFHGPFDAGYDVEGRYYTLYSNPRRYFTNGDAFSFRLDEAARKTMPLSHFCGVRGQFQYDREHPTPEKARASLENGLRPFLAELPAGTLSLLNDLEAPFMPPLHVNGELNVRESFLARYMNELHDVRSGREEYDYSDKMMLHLEAYIDAASEREAAEAKRYRTILQVYREERRRFSQDGNKALQGLLRSEPDRFYAYFGLDTLPKHAPWSSFERR